MEVTIKKIGEESDQERFILVQPETREVLTTDDVSERALRRFFHRNGVSEEVVEQSLERARQRYASKHQRHVDDSAETVEDDDLLFELGLGDDDESP